MRMRRSAQVTFATTGDCDQPAGGPPPSPVTATTSSRPDNNTSRKDTMESTTNIWTNTLYLTHRLVAATH